MYSIKFTYSLNASLLCFMNIVSINWNLSLVNVIKQWLPPIEYSIISQTSLYTSSSKSDAQDSLFLKGVLHNFPFMHPSKKIYWEELIAQTLSSDNMFSKCFTLIYLNRSYHICLEPMLRSVFTSCQEMTCVWYKWLQE